ncbi:hypothetical protein F4813DRAFT_395743 [Daldinia decipiens]|uniref:uncharacterized protein n=1 Tax=Daldinia decipiens TaxID=326647 RepID=UPI0020C211F4|nr:uncharacterized protein F4813DRAFT_395743 [Daldinia decipiens]KAI1658385.1 hypothetical protein F4813DRAFT_395743 [Daldinia decipiens]
MDLQIIPTADGRAGLAAQEHSQQSISQSYVPGDNTSNIPILDPHNFSNLTLDARLPGQPSHVSLSMLEALVPTKTVFFPVSSTPYWSLVEFSVKEVILRVLSDSLGSFQEACRTLELFSNEVREFLRKRNNSEPASHTLNEESVAYGCKYLHSRGLEKYSEPLKEYARRINDWPLDIDFSDLKLELLPESLEYKEPTVEFLPDQHQDSHARRFQNSTAKRVLSLSTESIAISVKIMKAAFSDTCKFFSTVESFRLPAGVVVVSPEGIKKLLEGGKYTIINPPFPAFSELHQFIICDNSPKHPTSLMADFPTSQNSTHLGHEGTRQPSRPYSTDSSDSRLHTYSNTSFFDDAISYRTRVVERALEDNLILRSSLADNTSSISLHPKLLLQPRKDAKCLLPGTGDREARELHQKGHRALLHFYLPAGYSVISPSGYKMNFDTPHTRESDGESLPGRGGEYIVVPPEHAVHADNYRRVNLATSDIAWINFKESVVVFRDGKMLPRTVGTGLHRLSIRNGGLRITCEDGEYDLTKALRNPDPHSLFTIKSVPIYTVKNASKQAVANPPTRNDATQYTAQNNIEMEEDDENSSYGPSNTATSALIGASQDRKRKQPYDAIEELPQKIPKTGPRVYPLAQSETPETRETREGNTQIITPTPPKEPQLQVQPKPKFRYENKAQLKARLKAQPMAQKQPRFAGVTTENAASLVRSVEVELQKSNTVPHPDATTQEEVLAQPQDEEQTQPEVQKKRPVRIVLTNKKVATPATPKEQPGTRRSSSANSQRTSAGNSQVQTQTQAQAQSQAQTQYPAKSQAGRRPRGRPAKKAQKIATSNNPHDEQSAAVPSQPVANKASSLAVPQARPQAETPSSRKNAQRRTSVPTRRSSRLSGGRENLDTQPEK